MHPIHRGRRFDSALCCKRKGHSLLLNEDTRSPLGGLGTNAALQSSLEHANKAAAWKSTDHVDEVVGVEEIGDFEAPVAGGVEGGGGIVVVGRLGRAFPRLLLPTLTSIVTQASRSPSLFLLSCTLHSFPKVNHPFASLCYGKLGISTLQAATLVLSSLATTAG